MIVIHGDDKYYIVYWWTCCVSIFPLALLFLNWFKVFKLMWNFQTSLKLNMLKSAIDSGNIKQNSEIIWQMFFKGHCDLQVCRSRCTFSLSLSEWRYFQKKTVQYWIYLCTWFALKNCVHTVHVCTSRDNLQGINTIIIHVR